MGLRPLSWLRIGELRFGVVDRSDFESNSEGLMMCRKGWSVGIPYSDREQECLWNLGDLESIQIKAEERKRRVVEVYVNFGKNIFF